MKKRERMLIYVLIIISILLIAGIMIYSLAPGEVPTPGHNISEISIPSGCVTGQFLKYDGTTWVCSDMT